LDAAFNNVGATFPPTPLADQPVEAFDQVMRVNLRGVFLAMKYEIPAMLANGDGAIVSMTATAGLLGVPGFAPYVTSKHGVIDLAETDALDYAAHNLRINAIAPGPIYTHHLERAGNALTNTLPSPSRCAVWDGRTRLRRWFCGRARTRPRSWRVPRSRSTAGG